MINCSVRCNATVGSACESSLIEIQPSRVSFILIVATIKIKGTDLRFDFIQTGEVLPSISQLNLLVQTSKLEN